MSFLQQFLKIEPVDPNAEHGDDTIEYRVKCEDIKVEHDGDKDFDTDKLDDMIEIETHDVKDILLTNSVEVSQQQIQMHQCNTNSTGRDVKSNELVYAKKRKRNINNWKTTICRNKRNRGESYISRTTKKEIPAKEIGPPCQCKCFDKIGIENIQEIFNSFWSSGGYNIQNVYLSKLVCSVGIKRSLVKKPPSRTLRRIHCQVQCNNEYKNVCFKAFCSIHGISEKRVRTVLKKVNYTGIISLDERGKHKTTNIQSVEMRAHVEEHIKSFAVVSSQYSRAVSPQRKYLPIGLNLNKLYDIYKEWSADKYPDGKVAKNNYYRSVFNKNFNIGFKPPISDICNICGRLSISIKGLDKEKDIIRIQELTMEKELHLRKAKIANDLLKFYKNSKDSVAAIAIDFQQALPTPKISNDFQYYKCKLWTYNFNVHNIKSGNATMYIWDETIAKRGSCEIASCLKKYVYSCIDPSEKELVIFSDNCSSQNKNINMVLACLQMIHEGKFTNIKHIFMTPGHSYLPCERDFDHIQKVIQHREVYNKLHFAHLIKNSRTVNPFNIVQINNTDIFHFDVLRKYITKKYLTGTNFKGGKIFEYSQMYKQGFEIFPFYTTDFSIKISLQKGEENIIYDTNFDLSKQILHFKYSSPIRIPSKKLKDIIDLMPFVPYVWKDYFDNAIAVQSTNTIDSEVKDDDDDENDDDHIEYY